MNEFYNHLKTYLKDDEINKLIKSIEEKEKHALILNLNKMNDETLLSIYPNLIPHPIIPHAYLFDKDEYQLGKSIYHELGCFYIQEPSAMLVSYLLNPEENDYILDLCAAPGGKTIGASLLMNGTGEIIANDLNKSRAEILKENVMRLGLGNILITSNDFSKIYNSYLNKFDKIILDTPCSGSGMFRKNDLMKEDWSLNKVYKNSMVQMSLIDIAYQMLKPGGRLVYSTCSYSYEEDEAVILHLFENSDAKLISLEHPLLYKGKDNIGVHLLPYLFPGEGHYICLIEKPGNKKKTEYMNKNPYKNLLPDDIKDFDTSLYFDTIYALKALTNYKDLYVIRKGIEVGKKINNEIIYSYHLAHYLKDYQNKIELNKEETISYIQGNQINKGNNFKGNVLLTYQNIPIDFAKTNGEIIKNHYPKNLRKKVDFNLL